MKGERFLLFLLIITKGNSMAFINDVEQNISAALMKTLSIDHMILLEEPNSTLINLQIFKNPTLWNKASNYQNTNQIIKYFRKEIFPAAPTLIVFKVDKIKSLITFLKTLSRVCH